MSEPVPEPAEGHLKVGRTARYWTLGAHDAEDVWFVLHGYRQLAVRFLSRFRELSGPARLVVAPEGLSRFYVSTERGRHGAESVVGASWMTREDREHEIEDYVAYLDDLADHLKIGDRTVTVLGFSQGAATATRWVVLGRLVARRLVLWGGFAPPDLDMDRAPEALSRTELLLVRGSDDPGLDEARAAEEAARLGAAGIPFRVVEYAGGHEIDPETLRGLSAP